MKAAVHCQASGSSQGTLILTCGSAYDKGAVDKAAQYAFAHIQEWGVLVPEGHLLLGLEIKGFGNEAGEPFLNVKKLHGTPSLVW